MAYQNIPRYNPTYGNRYGFRQRPIDNVGAPGAGAPTSTSGGSTRPGEGYHSGPSADTGPTGQVLDQGTGGDDGGNNAADVRGAASEGLGYARGQMSPGQIATNLLGFVSPVPGLGMLADKLGLPGSLDERLGTEVDPFERYGEIGTIGTEGGVFGFDGREYDPITGRGLNSYASNDAFLGGDYVQGIKDNPFSLGSWLSDPANAYDYDRTGTGAGLQSQGFQFGLNQGMYAADEELGTLPTQEEKDLLAQHVGQTEYGFEEHTVAPDTATNQAIQGLGYSGTGAAPAGSQFSSTGTFSSGGDDNNDDGSQTGSETSFGSQADLGSSFADDAAVSDSGGGGGGK